ncbi:MAG: hypothetical protein ISR83_03305 [Candidatus Marinimicrobia bacterium]|nr:hypothetical protein [Candidatus Neomarinimicrobiota bacterium]
MKKYAIIVLFWVGILPAQNQVILLSPKVGSVIDVDENEFYGIFPNARGFESAQIFMGDGQIYEARIVQSKRGKYFTTSKFIPMKEYAKLQVSVNSQPELTEERRELIKENLFYLRVPEILEDIEKPQYVKLKIVGGKKIKGTLVAFKDDTVHVQTAIKMLHLDIHELESISYRLSTRDVLVLKPIIRSVSAIIGLGFGEYWNEQRNPELDQRWYYRFFGITGGLIVSGEIYEAIATMISPTETFALTESEFNKN